ncbi:MAG: Type III pantothenate kinase [Chroococcidiopsis sp. SAG 2025]|uniref:pantothenate kinase n=1 Tax=Chroococcidiopsis sp. SAG 2025 TaxID=171389 RepID=UPI00293721FB|nr:pantothenate kinase [Chroococcidiopsis sp. SAG 2025]MDV2992644.1 Type III pantothenate kinase [Chroococcidiopsis sp. SAG 2025]
METWLGLEIGNSRLHWGWFAGENLQITWDTPHLPESIEQQLAQCKTFADLPQEILSSIDSNISGRIARPYLLPIYIASVVPSQTVLWQAYPEAHAISLDRIPLLRIYPTLGIDRALAVLGAGETFGFPVLVIDAGTALTFTGADGDRCLVGGAILPGLSLQLQSLGQKTANLPSIAASEILSLPKRWAMNTPEAIQSGVIYTLIASIRDFITAWWDKFPDSQICFKGGDGKLLLEYLRSLYPELTTRIIDEPNLTFWGMRSSRQGARSEE